MAGLLAGCGGDPDLDTVGPMAQPSVVSALPSDASGALRERIKDNTDLAIAGQPLNADLLDRFYTRHDFEPVWATRPAQTQALVDAVLHAGDQGLNPELFHASLLRRRGTFSPLDRELLLSDAFLAYADALARGAVPPERRRDDEVLTPEPVDVAAVVSHAMHSDNPAGVILALAPSSRTYAALLQALHAAQGKGGTTSDRYRKIVVNLERQRWLPRDLPDSRAWVNTADQSLVLYQNGEPVFTTRVVVGQDIRMNQSPEFQAKIDASFYNPPWVIPADIAAREILPEIAKDPDYLTKNHMVLLPQGEAEQLPGPDAGLGLIMFDMPNKFDVYLHDTPDRDTIFKLADRRISHGCIRVQHPQQFAALLQQIPIEEIQAGIAAGNTTRNDLPDPVPVFVVYQTAFVDTKGTLQFRPDFYKRDDAIWQKLQTRSNGPVLMSARDAGAPLRLAQRDL